jgi:hypothetical protein
LNAARRGGLPINARPIPIEVERCGQPPVILHAIYIEMGKIMELANGEFQLHLG